MRTKEITVELKLLAQPKQFHSITVGVSATVQLDETDQLLMDSEHFSIKDKVGVLREELSEALTKGIHDEIKKLYGEASARAVLAAYFASGGKEP